MGPGTTFQPVLGDTWTNPNEYDYENCNLLIRFLTQNIIIHVCRVKRVILCSGKHFYALDAYRREKGLKNTALIRLEVTRTLEEYINFYLLFLSSSQLLCPFPSGYLHQELKKYSSATGIIC